VERSIASFPPQELATFKTTMLEDGAPLLDFLMEVVCDLTCSAYMHVPGEHAPDYSDVYDLW
jgi:hypothetical protein